jgi:beta-glucosidase
VLVENDGTLPLALGGGTIAVVGPIADSARDLLGDYAHLLHIETLREMRHRANPFGFPANDVINPTDELSGIPTILDALRERFGADRIAYARGVGLRDGDGCRHRGGGRGGRATPRSRSSSSASGPA